MGTLDGYPPWATLKADLLGRLAGSSRKAMASPGADEAIKESLMPRYGLSAYRQMSFRFPRGTRTSRRPSSALAWSYARADRLASSRVSRPDV